MSYEHNKIGDIENFVDHIIKCQQDSVEEIVEEMESVGDKSCKYQLHRHLNILLSIKSTMETYL